MLFGSFLDESDLKKAYKRATLKFHPDKWGQATEVTSESLPPGL